jgi:hypothetical protein
MRSSEQDYQQIRIGYRILDIRDQQFARRKGGQDNQWFDNKRKHQKNRPFPESNRQRCLWCWLNNPPLFPTD